MQVTAGVAKRDCRSQTVGPSVGCTKPLEPASFDCHLVSLGVRSGGRRGEDAPFDFTPLRSVPLRMLTQHTEAVTFVV